MNQDQLQKARQSRWRQDGNALLTLDDAERWLAETSLCLYLPRYQHIPAPAPSFVEAIAGRPDPTPAPEQIAAASQMLARLVASGAAIALNLFGSASGIVGEQPDFLATPEALPYLYALQPQRNPKRPPTTTGASRISPLAVEAFRLLTREGALTAIALRERLGREVTEAATLRALGELWHTMRVVPVPDEHGAPAHWELLNTRHARELNIGSTQSQTTALSILVSFYLQSAIAATAEEAEVFLSPLASRSRIREVIHGLSATRQLASFSLNGEAQLYVEGTLPELPAEEEAVAAAHQPGAVNADLDAGLEENEPSFPEAAATRPPIRRRPSFADRARGTRDRTAQPQERHSGERRPRREGGFGPPQRRSFSDRRPAREPRSFEQERPPRPPRPDRPSRPDFRERRERPGSDTQRGKKRFDRPSRFEKPVSRRDTRSRGDARFRPGNEQQSGERRDRPGLRREGDRSSFPKSGERRPFREKGDRPPFRKDREQRPFAKDRPSRPFERNREDRPFRKDRPARPFEKNRPQGRPPGDKAGRPRRDRDREQRPFQSRPEQRERRPFRPEGERPSRPGSFRKPEGDRPPRSFDRPRSFGKGPFRPGKPGGKRFDNRPAGQQNRGPKRPGGSQPPRRKPRTDSSEGDEG